MTVDSALGLIQRGWSVFPAALVDGKKVPIGELVEHGFRDATTHPKRVILWWRVRPDALVGVAMPKDTVALDVDSPEAFDAAGLELPDGPGQETPRGGYHRFFRTDGRPVRQTVKEIPGSDTRVGGRGYVIAWQPDEFPEVESLPMAPEWLYGPDESTASGQDSPLVVRRVRRGRQVEVATFQVGARDNELARLAGKLRKEGLGPSSIYAVFKDLLANGQIESPPSDPMTDKDLQRIAGSIGTKQSDAVDRQHRPEPERHFANDIRGKKYDPLYYFVDELIPEGLGIIGGASKIGKSWMVLQAAMEISDGRGSFLDRAIREPRPVLYYALEDGERRANSRMEVVTGFHDLDTTWLEFRFEAPLLTEGFEEDVERWLIDNEGGMVFVDVLARVHPEQRGRGSAYNMDYSMLKPTHDVLKRLRKSKDKGGYDLDASVAFVTHLRKQGAEDPYAMLQGTTGVMGSSDWTWVVMRKRMEVAGTIQVTGRDIVKEPYVEAVFNGIWTAVGTTHRGGSKQRNVILDALLTEGDLTVPQVRKHVNETVLLPTETPWTDNSVSEKMNALEDGHLVERAGYLAGKGGGVVWHALGEAEIAARKAEQRVEAAAVETASGHGRALPVTRVRATRRPAREESPPHSPQAPHSTPEPMEGVEGVDGSLPARARRTRVSEPHDDNGHAPSAPLAPGPFRDLSDSDVRADIADTETPR